MKIGVASSNLNFAGAVIAELDRRGHEVFVYQHTDNAYQSGFGLGQIEALCETVFVDFAQYPLEPILADYHGRIVVRAHRIEMYAEQIETLRWSRCDTLVFVAEHVRERFMARLQAEQPRSVVTIPHVGVDLATFELAQRDWKPPWRILLAGNVVPKKRVYTAIQLLADLPEQFHLVIVGQGGQSGYGNAEYHHNCGDLVEDLGLSGRVESLAPMSREDLARLMSACHLILSASNEEGCHTAAAEGMATGLTPLVNCWRGAERIYPQEWIWRTPLELYRLAHEWAGLGEEEKSELSRAHRQYAQERFDGAVIARQLADVIEGRQPGSDGEPGAREQASARRWLELMSGLGGAGERHLVIGPAAAVAASLAQEAGLQVSDDRTRWAGRRDVVSLIGGLDSLGARAAEHLIGQQIEALARGGRIIVTLRWDDRPGEVRPKTVAKWLQANGCELVGYRPLGEDEAEFVVVGRRK